MKPIVGTLCITVTLLVVACDPGTTIRQAQTHIHSLPDTIGRVIVSVGTTHQLSGEAWYDPEVKVTNMLDSSINVTSIELVTPTRSYTNTSQEPENYPKAIQPGNTQKMGVSFRLDAGVHETFRQPAELRVHYLAGSKEEVARITVLKGPTR